MNKGHLPQPETPHQEQEQEQNLETREPNPQPQLPFLKEASPNNHPRSKKTPPRCRVWGLNLQIGVGTSHPHNSSL